MDISPSTRARRSPPAAVEPSYLLSPDAFWTGTARAATIGIFLLLLTGALDLARVLLLPLVSAFIFAAMLGPLQTKAARYRVPPALFALAAVLAIIGAVNLLVILTSAPLIEWFGRGPDAVSAISSKLQVLARPFAALRDLQRAFSPGGSNVGMNLDVATLVEPALVFLTPAIGELVVFLAALFFFLIGRRHLRRHLVLLFATQEARLLALRVLNDIEEDLTRYIATTGAINLGLGVIVGVATWLIGLPNAPMWGVLACVLNFLPYIGPLIMAVALFVAGLVVFPSLGHALIAPAFFVGLATLEGHFVTPNIVGRRLDLSPILVFIALVFWTWLWGPMGALLATPLVIAGMVVINDLFPKRDVELPE
ncbi:MAG TPA: AI-2E family transporter [Xanthobacteraceae bacterium]|jgi:predicted PurR-regulated permease PerM|nr:AI-2E family transporter [Xanthobacteraceae bacterium]